MPPLKQKKAAVETEVVETEVVETEVVEENLPANVPETGHVETGLVEVDQDDYLDWDSQDESEMEDDRPLRFPTMKLSQKRETEGKYVCQELDEVVDTMTVVILATQTSCGVMPEPYDEDSKPICFSFDGINPEPLEEDEEESEERRVLCLEPNACQAVPVKEGRRTRKVKPCVFGNWDDGKPPECPEATSMLLLEVYAEEDGEEDGELATGSMYKLTCRKAARSAYVKLDDMLRSKRNMENMKRKRKGLPPNVKKCLFTFDISSSMKESKKGDYFVPVFSNVQMIDSEMHDLVKGYAHQAYIYQQRNAIERNGEGSQD